MTLFDLILATLVALTQHYPTNGESPEHRLERYTLYAHAIDDATARATCTGKWEKDESCRRVWFGPRSSLVAPIIELGDHESHFAEYVGSGRCHEGKPGERCDDGRSRGLWQAQAAACPEIWSTDPGSPEAVYAGAWCAAKILSVGVRVCTNGGQEANWGGAFGRYAGAGCKWSGAAGREIRLRRISELVFRTREKLRAQDRETAEN